MTDKVQRKRRARSLEILGEAMTLAAEEGLDGLSMHGLARRLGLTVGALYRYFDSKDALLAELERSVVTALHDLLLRQGRAFDAARPDLSATRAQLDLAGLLLVTDAYVRLAEADPHAAQLIAAMAGDPRPMLATASGLRVMEAVFAVFEEVSRRFDAAATSGALRPGDGLRRTVIYWSGIQGVANLRKLSRFAPDRLDVDDLIAGLADTLLAGWGAPAGDLVVAREALAAYRRLEATNAGHVPPSSVRPILSENR